MSYIRIANKAEKVNRLYLEKLGLSTKRDNDETIGQFGSGSKFAPLAALRNGWEWINVGEDDLGPYKLEYVIKEENGINCVYYLYDDEVLKPSSFVAEAGLLSWDTEFQIFREAFANALDDFIEFGNEYSVEVVDEVKYEPGTFAVYLTACDELLNIVRDFDKYFTINRNSIAETIDGSKIYASFDNEANFYYKGVLVHTDKVATPMFNYEFRTITLNEERRIRNVNDLGYKISLLMSYLKGDNHAHINIAEIMIHNHNRDRWEWTLPKYQIENYFAGMTDNNAFKVAWGNIYGDSVAVTPELMRFKAQFALRDVKTVTIESDILYSILSKCGVPCADSVLGDDIEYEFMTLTGSKLNMLNEALGIVRSYITDFDSTVKEVKVFIPQGEQSEILGVASMNKNSIYLSVYCFDSMSDLIGTIVHEYDHIKTRIGDEDTAFRSVADRHIGNLLIKLHESEA